MRSGAGALGLALIGLAALAAAPAQAEDPAAPPRAERPPAGPMILNLLSQPIESQEQAFRESLRRSRAGSNPSGAPSDGTLRLGQATLTITVKDPCPDGDMSYQVPLPRPLPGRTRR